jgi:hypothetical protein
MLDLELVWSICKEELGLDYLLDIPILVGENTRERPIRSVI